MDRDRFVDGSRARWEALERALDAGEPVDGAEVSALSAAYRSLTADLSRARGLDMPDDVLDHLDRLAARAHNALYGARRRTGRSIIGFVFRDVPRQVRTDAVFFWVAFVVFFGPFLLGSVLASTSDSYAFAVLPPEQLEQMREMYAGVLERGGAGMDAQMAGYYVYNNIGIAFRCFATGALAGLGSLYFLLYNGLVLGTVHGHLAVAGHGDNLLQFVSGHATWELLGIVLSGAAGLKLGWAVIDTGGRTRIGSVRAAGPALARLVGGAGFMLLVAAVIEGFWSAGPAPREVKYAFGALQVVLVVLWLGASGRGGEP